MDRRTFLRTVAAGAAAAALHPRAASAAQAWQITSPADGQIEGYPSSTSVAPGEPLTLHVNTTSSTWDLHVYRMGWYGGAGAQLVHTRLGLPGQQQQRATPDPTSGLVDNQWPASYTATIPPTWPTGVYLARLTAAADGRQCYVPFVVRAIVPTAPTLIVHGVMTDQAYNNWGSKSLYDAGSWGTTSGALAPFAPTSKRAVKVSFNRPFRSGHGAGLFLRWEYPAVRWLEREGIAVDYVTDLDVRRDPTLLRAYRTVLLVGHDEYWNPGMRGGYDAAVAAGTNLCVLAANTGYWQVRFESSARVMVCWKNAAADPQKGEWATVQWRQPPLNRPESMLLGSMYASNDFGTYPLVVTAPSVWPFAGAGVAAGESFPGVCGYEIDRAHPASQYPRPAGLQTLTRSPTRTRSGATVYQEASFWQHPTGGWVFNAGTINWAWALDDFDADGASRAYASDKLRRVTRNLLAA